MNAIEVVGLRRTFPDAPAPALTDLSFQVAGGEIVALLGANGAGKTTLLDVIGTVLLPDAGEVRICGHDVVRDTAMARRCLGYAMAGAPGLYERLTVRHNLEFFAALHAVRDVASRIEEVAGAIGFGDVLGRQVRQLSDGMRQKVAIGIALLPRPRVLLFDEPARSLDRDAAARLRALVRRLVASGAVAAALVATHDDRDIGDMATRTLVLERGRLAA